MNTSRQQAILTIDASDKLLPRSLICASDRARERSLASNVMLCLNLGNRYVLKCHIVYENMLRS